MTKYYDIPDEPIYNPEIRELQDTDRVSATDTFNPLFSRLIENTEAVRNEKFDKMDIAQEIGANTDKVMSQKAVTDALAEIGTGGSVVMQSIMSAIYPVGSIYMSANPTNPGELFGGTWEAWGNGKVPVGVDTNDSDFNSSGKTGGAKNVTLTAAQSGTPAHNHTFTGKAVTSGNQSQGHTHTGHSHAHNVTIPAHRHELAKLNGKPTYSFGWNKTSAGVANEIKLITNGSHIVQAQASANADLIETQVYTGQTIGNNTELKAAVTVATTNAGTGSTGGISANHNHSVTAAGTISNNTATNATDAHSNLQPYITCYMWKRTA